MKYQNSYDGVTEKRHTETDRYKQVLIELESQRAMNCKITHRDTLGNFQYTEFILIKDLIQFSVK